MIASRQRPLAWLLVLVMAWAAVWCCCTPPAKAGVVRSCCVARQSRPACPGHAPADCPIDHVRQTSLAPAVPVLPDARPTLCVPAAVLSTAAAVVSTAAVVRPIGLPAPPCPPPTLIALHTSLVC